MLSAWQNVAEGEEGIRAIVGRLNTLKNYYGTAPSIRKAALAIASTGIDNDQWEHAARLAQFVKDSVVYVADPVNAEWVVTPEVMLGEILRTGRTSGDCDEHVLLFASLAEAIGIPCDIASVVSVTGVTWDHVIAVLTLDGREIDLDLCAKGAYQPIYSDKLFAP